MIPGENCCSARSAAVGRDRDERQSLRVPRPVADGRPGVTFADPDYPGIELILPDLEFIESQQTGSQASPHPRPRRPYRRLALSRRRAEGAALRDAVHRRPDRRKARREGTGLVTHHRRGGPRAGAVQGALRRFSHSIPEGNGLLIETPFGRVPHRRLEDRRHAVLGEARDRGADADRRRRRPGFGVRFDQRVPARAVGIGGKRPRPAAPPGRGGEGAVLVTTFASNAARLQTIGEGDRDRAQGVRRRELDRSLRVARQPDIARLPRADLVRRGQRLPREDV